MTLDEAIKWANSRHRNFYLNYYVLKWNDGYCVVTTSFIERNKITEWEYSTEHKPETRFDKFY